MDISFDQYLYVYGSVTHSGYTKELTVITVKIYEPKSFLLA